MSKFTCVVLCAVAVSFSNVYAVEDENASFDEDYEDFRDECLDIYEMTKDDLYGGNESAIHPCYWGCFYKKFGLLNEKGQYDLNNFLVYIKKSMPGDDQGIAMKEKMAKKCESVKDAVVSDGEAGCERGALLGACLLKITEASMAENN